MSESAVQSMKNRIWRRIVVKSAVLGFWAVGMLYVALQGNGELAQSTYFYMVFAIIAAWAVSTIRDVRRLRDEAALRRAAIEESDERNVLIVYKATRLAIVIMACLFPIALFVFALNDMQDAINLLVAVVCVFAAVYMASWFYISKKC